MMQLPDIQIKLGKMSEERYIFEYKRHRDIQKQIPIQISIVVVLFGATFFFLERASNFSEGNFIFILSLLFAIILGIAGLCLTAFVVWGMPYEYIPTPSESKLYCEELIQHNSSKSKDDPDISVKVLESISKNYDSAIQNNCKQNKRKTNCLTNSRRCFVLMLFFLIICGIIHFLPFERVINIIKEKTMFTGNEEKNSQPAEPKPPKNDRINEGETVRPEKITIKKEEQ